MNLEKYTQRAQTALQGAQTAAINAGHQQLTPSHLLASLLEDRDQLAANLIRASDGQVAHVEKRLNDILDALPSVSGGDGRLYASPDICLLYTSPSPRDS